ncbi:MAG: hypothetical protein Q7S94_09305 [Gallionella sp.]|nr:hypothetical protein [Gallionella sp.]
MPLKLLLVLLAISISSFVSAISLGEGQIRSHVGEPFMAHIALLGSYSKDVRFSQVNSAECRSSLIGMTENGCDSLYEGRLSFLIKQGPDKQYYLSVAGERSDEMFYRVIIRSESEAGGTAFNTFVFLPEFKVDPENVPVVSSDVEALPAIAAVLPKSVATKKHVVPAQAALPDEMKSEQKRKARVQPVAVVPPAEKAAGSQLQIKKHGEYADDIYALEKENTKIEQQIVLLEKHISLLKEVIRLKSEVGASAVVEAGVIPALPVNAPVSVTAPPAVPPTPVTMGQNMLTWLLLAVVLVLSALLGWVYRKLNSLKLEDNSVSTEKAVPPHLTSDARTSLDLTGTFIKPRW